MSAARNDKLDSHHGLGDGQGNWLDLHQVTYDFSLMWCGFDRVSRGTQQVETFMSIVQNILISLTEFANRIGFLIYSQPLVIRHRVVNTSNSFFSMVAERPDFEPSSTHSLPFWNSVALFYIVNKTVHSRI